MGLKLSRRDRAACVLAYEILRDLRGSGPVWGAIADVKTVLDGAQCGLDFLERLYQIIDAHEPVDLTNPRLLRARLALYLRALLRAAAGDCGPWRCRTCGRFLPRHHFEGAARHRCLADGGRYWRPVHPLWGDARPTP